MIGEPVPRKEDDRLLTGRGCYTDDVWLPGQLYAHFVRSPHAHARIGRIDAGAALALTGRDALADGLQPIPCRAISPNPHEVQLRNSDGTPPFIAPYFPLPADKVRYVGQAVALVIAESPAAAKDAAERVSVEYEPLAPDGAVWDECPSNVALDCTIGDAAAVQGAFASAAYVIKLDTQLNRVTGVPMEARSVVASFADGRYTVHTTSGGVQKHRSEIAAVLGVPDSAVRVVTRDLGGNYGTRNNAYPEFALIAWAARRVGRPVKWTCERTEAFLTDEHARDLRVDAELALDAAGSILAFRSHNTSDVGAQAVSFIPLAKGMGVSTSVYHVPLTALRGRAVYSARSPTTPYRAAGRPEVMFVIERLLDVAARRHGFDRLELRRRNLAARFPYRNPQGLVYDSGDYLGVQERVAALADWAGFARRRDESRARGRLRGIGLGHYIELNTGAPRERTEITVRPDAVVDVVIGTLSSGQGHETSFSQVVADWLQVPFESVRILAGDSDVASVGGGSHSGRSMRMAASVMRIAIDHIIERGRELAADMVEAAAADIEYVHGRFRVKGTDRSVGLFEVAEKERLVGMHDETTPLPSYPFGCAVCEVEVDPETGVVDIVRYSTVDDCGRAVNPLILHGQAHGGIVAGVGQALWERCAYDADGQLLSASFMDYALPRADQFPFFATEISEVPSTTHPLGMRGGGEGGTTPALAAVANAVCDAIGVEHLDLPLTPERVWRALRGATIER